MSFTAPKRLSTGPTVSFVERGLAGPARSHSVLGIKRVKFSPIYKLDPNLSLPNIMPSRLRLLSLPVIASIAMVAALATTAHAQLVLNVDSDSQTFWFTGSDTGTPTDIGSADIVRWTAGSGSQDSHDITTAGLLNGSPGDVSDFHLYISGANGDKIFFRIEFDAPGETTLTGTGSSFAFDYGNSLSSFKGALLEDLSLTSIPTWEQDNTFSAISVNHISAVPEPSTYALLASLFALGFTGARRRVRR